MLFLTEPDFTPIIRDAFLQQVLDEDSSILATAEMQAMSTVEGYLFELYDMPAIWACSGAQRNAHLVRLMIGIIRYDLYQRLPKGGFGTPSDVASDRSEAMDWLKLVCTGKLSANLPRKVVGGQPTTRTRWGSDPRQNWNSNSGTNTNTNPFPSN